jgi:hypothetical protein
MNEVVVPKEAIDRAARAWYEAEHPTSLFGHKRLDWDSVLLANARARLSGFAAAACEAAAPLILAAELERIADDTEREAASLENPAPGTAAYSTVSVLVDVAADLRSRAVVLRGDQT